MQLVVTYIPVQTQETRALRRRSRLLHYRVEVALGLLANLACSVLFVWLLIWLGGEMWNDLMH